MLNQTKQVASQVSAPVPAQANYMDKPTSGLAVDAATHGNPGTVEYQIIELGTGKLIYRSKEYASGTNNIGEYLAVVHGLAWLKQQGRMNERVWTDSQTARAWVTAGRCKTKYTTTDDELRELIARADRWLANNPERPLVGTWMTSWWNETPADYGRK